MDTSKNIATGDLSFSHLLQSAPDALVIVDPEGRIVLANSRTEALFGHPNEALVGQPIEILLPERYRLAHRQHRAGYAKAPFARPMGQDLQLAGLHADGSEFPVEISLSPLQTANDNLVIASIRDTSKQRKSEDLFRNMLEAAPDAMLIADMQGNIKLVNSQAEEILGYSRQELLEKSLDMLVPERFRSDHAQLRHGYHGSPHVRPMGAGLELYALHKDGNEIPVEIGLSPIETDEGMWIMAALRDISKAKRLQDQLTHLSITDELTGLLNRRGFLEVGGTLRAIARRNKVNLVLVMVDIDGLKEINDELGHAVGDQCILDVAAILQQSMRESDVIARWGGDEFLVLGLEAEKTPTIALVERIMLKLETFTKEQARDYSLSVSVGVAVGAPDEDEDFDGLIKAADDRMYQEKNEGN